MTEAEELAGVLYWMDRVPLDVINAERQWACTRNGNGIGVWRWWSRELLESMRAGTYRESDTFQTIRISN